MAFRFKYVDDVNRNIQMYNFPDFLHVFVDIARDDQLADFRVQSIGCDCAEENPVDDRALNSLIREGEVGRTTSLPLWTWF